MLCKVVSPFLMGTVRAGVLLVESPFQGSESHSRAAGGRHSPGRAGPGVQGSLHTTAPRAGPWGQPSPALHPSWSRLVNFTVASVLLAERFSQQGVRQPSGQTAILAGALQARRGREPPLLPWAGDEARHGPGAPLSPVPSVSALTRSLSQQDIDGQALLLLTLPTVQECMELKLGPAIKLCHQIERVKVAFYAQYAN